MSKLNKIFNSVPVQIPDRSGFDLSHEVLTTAQTGTVVPVTYFDVLPGDTISMGSMMKVTLPPFAVPFMGRIDAELTAAFIPYRLLWAGWQSFITQNNGTNTYTPPAFGFDRLGAGDGPNTGSIFNVPTIVPRVSVTPSLGGPGTLANYLGVKFAPGLEGSSTVNVSAFPFLAYHKFCDDWIRDDNTMKPFFPKMFTSTYQGTLASSDFGSWALTGRFAPYSAFVQGATSSPIFTLQPLNADSESTLGDGIPFDTSLGLGSLRQRCWAKDYFTTATTRPQAGADSSVVFDTSGDTGQFTIASLRAANALQRWLERNNLSGTEYGSQILAHFGVTPPDAVLDRSVLLGSVRTPVVVSSVANTNGDGAAAGAFNKNPYGNTLGSAAGFGSGGDRGSLIDNFTAKEHGLVMVFFTLIPHAYYNSGISRDLLRAFPGDFAWPEFSGIGDQPVYNAELQPMNASQSLDYEVFGYQQRYADYKHKLDVVSGLLADGNNLSSYALQRTFDGTPELSAEFLEIPTNFLDQVMGVSNAISQFGCMVNAYFDAKALRTLPVYSLPHL